MQHADFVHLHNHSDYSLLDGATSIDRMVARAAELRMPALALTDHGSLFGAIEFYLAARKAGVKPIVGMEAYVTRGRRQDRTKDTAHHLVLLARDEVGFKNLMRLSSLAFLEGFYYKPRVDHDVLGQHAQGLLALSACPQGEVASDLLEDRDESALRTAGMYRDMFGAENYFLEIQNHGLDIEDKIRGKVLELSRKTGIPIVATNDCHYLNAEDTDAQDVLLCIQTGKVVSEAQRMRATANLHFRSVDEMKRVFADTPDALRNTIAIAERCNLQMQFGKPLLPEFPLPPGKASAEDYLRELAWEGLRGRYPEIGDELRQRLEYELGVIIRMGFASYMLIVRDFIDHARRHGIGVGPGRGSVAGSLVAYCLGITKVDPLKHSLYFERFLNPERVTMPDIDIDFDDLRRGEVIEYVKQKYGEGNVTQIITFGTMGAKGVVRDVGRALGLAFADVDKIAKLVPDQLGMTLDKALELSPDFKNLPARGPEYARLLHSARVLEGLARHASTHAAGVLITPGPLLDYVPLYRQKDESVTTQWDMKAVEKAGLLKMDFLGLRTLSVLDESRRLVKETRGIDIDLDTLRDDDAETYQVFQRAETVAIFQFESSGMRDYLKKLKPTVFGDLTAMNALYRPGPMENIPYFIRCKHGLEVVRYEHPALEPILKDTYGVFVYQEQVMAAANVLAGFSLAKGDELRRAMGKKNVEEMAAKRAEFIEGCKKNRIPEAKAANVFATMEKFAGYGFNKCVTSDTRLMSADTGEYTTIGDLFQKRRPFRVHALNDDWQLEPRRMLDVMWNGRKPVFELVTAGGKRITATGNHPFRTLEGWKKLEDLRPGERIAAPRRMMAYTRKSWPRHEVIALAGLIAEGNTCHPGTLYFYGNDLKMIEDFRAAISQFTNTVARIYTRSNGRHEVAANTGRGTMFQKGQVPWNATSVEGNLAVQSVAPRYSGAFAWAHDLGIIGKKAHEKFVPPEVFELCDEQIRLFLGRLWSGDGYVAGEKLNGPFYATSSARLASDVQTLLLRLGILSGIHTKSFRYRGGHRTGYTVNLLGERAIRDFNRLIVPHLVGRERQAHLLRSHIIAGQHRLTSRDTLPAAVRTWIQEERVRRGITWEQLEVESMTSVKELYGKGSPKKRGFRRLVIWRIACALDSERLRRIAGSDVFWDEVVSVTPKGEQDTYDLTVEKDHNFVANGLIVHNSHSAAYALLAYQSGYLKAHHPAEFMAATMTSEVADSARIATLIEECRRMKLEILPPDVNRSEWRFTIEDGKIRYGLGAVRNVGQAAVEALVAARAEGGAFRDLFDVANRAGVKLNRRMLESLVAAGACDAFGADRATLFAASGRMLEHAASLQRERASGQSSLFGDAGGTATVVAPSMPPAEPWPARERTAKEKEALGFYLTEHPLDPLREELAQVASHTIADAVGLEDGAEARIAGLVAEVKTFATRMGKVMATVAVEDLTGRVDCTFFPDLFEQQKARLVADTLVVVSGRIEVRDLGTKLIVGELRSLDEARETYRAALHLEVRAEDLSVAWLDAVDAVLSSHPGPCEVYLAIVMPDRSRNVSRSRRYRVLYGDTILATLRARFPALRARWAPGVS